MTQDETRPLPSAAGPSAAGPAAVGASDGSGDGTPGVSTAAGTGNGAVDAALSRLDELDQRETSEHVEVYEDVHRVLHETLTEGTGESGSRQGQPRPAHPGAS